MQLDHGNNDHLAYISETFLYRKAFDKSYFKEYNPIHCIHIIYCGFINFHWYQFSWIFTNQSFHGDVNLPHKNCSHRCQQVHTLLTILIIFRCVFKFVDAFTYENHKNWTTTKYNESTVNDVKLCHVFLSILFVVNYGS